MRTMNSNLAFRELSFSLPRLKVALFILVLGFFGPLLSAALRSSVHTYLQERTRQILSADLTVAALRPLTDVESEILERVVKPVKTSEEIEFVTMARTAEQAPGNRAANKPEEKTAATLVQVKAVDADFPVVGEFDIQGRGIVTSGAPLSESQVAWAFPEVLAELGVKIGDKIHIGRSEFTVSEVLNDGPGLSGMPLAPRLYIGRKFVDATGLTQFGSQVHYRRYLQIPQGQDAEAVSDQYKSLLESPDIQVHTASDATAGSERFFQFFNIYLVSISMIIFALSWVSAFYILQTFMQERVKNAAILLTFGASRALASALFSLQIFSLLIFAFLIATGLTEILIAFAPSLAGDQIPRGFSFHLTWVDVGELALTAFITGLAFTAAPVIKLYSSRLQDLLQESSGGVIRYSLWSSLATYPPLGLVFLWLAERLLGNWRDALILGGGLIAAALIGWVLARVIFRTFFQAVRNRPGSLRLIAMQLSRSRFGLNLCFVTLLIATLVMNLVPHLLKSAVGEIQVDGRDVPTLFMFNIPESEVDHLKTYVSSHDSELRFLSPMILARLMKVNGQATDNDNLQRFPVRLSYRDKPIPSEKITAGKAFSGPYDPTSKVLPEISMEYKYAERNHFKLGDEIEFDLQGVPLVAKVTSLRRVKWSDFNPNFFMIFQPGVLDDAPKTFLANINFNGDVHGTAAERIDRKGRLQYDLIREFPDVNILDIGRTLNRALEIITSVLGPVRVAAWIAVVMSFSILVGVMMHNLKQRDREVEIEKLLGADASLIRRLLTSEYAITALAAGSIGSLASLIMTWQITLRVFDVPMRIDYLGITAALTLTIGVTALIAYLSCNQVLGLRGASRRM